MAFLVTNVESAKAASSGGSFIDTSGIYELTIKAAAITAKDTGSSFVDFYFEEGPIAFGLTIGNKDGSEGFGMPIMHSLAAILGLEEISDPEPQTVKLKNSTKDLICLTDLTGATVKVRLQREYKQYNGKINESFNVKGFYRTEDNATASEIIDGSAPGTKYEKDQAYASEIKYTDVTEEEVAAWKASNSKNSGTAGGATQATQAKPATNPFAKNN